MFATHELKKIRDEFTKRFHVTHVENAKASACEIDYCDGVEQMLRTICDELYPSHAIHDFEEMLSRMRNAFKMITVMALGTAAIVAIVENAFDLMIELP